MFSFGIQGIPSRLVFIQLAKIYKAQTIPRGCRTCVAGIWGINMCRACPCEVLKTFLIFSFKRTHVSSQHTLSKTLKIRIFLTTLIFWLGNCTTLPFFHVFITRLFCFLTHTHLYPLVFEHYWILTHLYPLSFVFIYFLAHLFIS